MDSIDSQPRVITDLDLHIDLTELIKKIRTSSQRPAILASAETTLTRVTNCWNPSFVYRWLPVTQVKTGTVTLSDNGTAVTFTLGHSARFVEPAGYTLVAAYTAGTALEEEYRKSTADQDYLEAYFIDLIALLVLEKTGDMVKRIAEQQAAERHWKVSPFLSPGSVHGWMLEEQFPLCSLLPLDEIGVSIRPDGVLSPFKSLTCMIGIGAEYTSPTVGTTCQVCSKRQSCEMQHDFEG